MPSDEYQSFIASISEPLVDAGDSMEVARAKLEALHGHPVADSTSVRWTDSGGVRCAWVDACGEPGIPPDHESARPIMFLCHGGAFISACGDGYLFYAEMLSTYCDALVCLVDYRLAPQFLFPSALNDCVDAYRGLLQNAVSCDDVVFVGDSCGGGIAVAALVALRDEGVQMPAGLACLGGWFDLQAGSESALHPVGPDPFAAAGFTRARGRDYVGPDGDPSHPLASPVNADPIGLPAMLLQVGQIDLTRDEAFLLAAKAARCGVAVQVDVWPGMVHGFQGLAAARIPESIAALQAVGRFVHDRTAAAHLARADPE